MKEEPITPRYLSEKQAEIYTSLSRDQMRELRILGLPYIQAKTGGKIYYDRVDIDNFLIKFKSNN